MEDSTELFYYEKLQKWTCEYIEKIPIPPSALSESGSKGHEPYLISQPLQAPLS